MIRAVFGIARDRLAKRREWFRVADEMVPGVALVLVLLFLCCGGFLTWNHFVDEPRRERAEAENRQAERDSKRKDRDGSAGARWTAYPGRTDLLGLDGLDGDQVPVSERYSWQPEGLVAVLGSHSGRHWTTRSYEDGVAGVCWLPDGRIASCGGDGVVRVWRRGSLRELAALPCPDERALAVACSADGRFLAACGDSSDEGEKGAWLRVWRVTEEGFTERGSFAWRGWRVGGVALSPDGRWLAASGGKEARLLQNEREGWVQLWAIDPSMSQPLREVWTFACPAPAWALTFSPDGRWLAAGEDAGSIHLWDLDAEDPRVWRPLTNALLIAGPVFLALGVLLWRRSARRTPLPQPTPRPRRRPKDPHPPEPPLSRLAVAAVACALVGVVLLTGGLIAWWTGPGMSRGTTSRATPPSVEVTALAFSPDGRLLVSGDSRGEIAVWDFAGGKLTLGETVIPTGAKTLVWALVVSPDGRSLISGHHFVGRSIDEKPSASGAPLQLWSLGKRVKSRGNLLRPGQGVAGVAFSPDGSEFIAATSDPPLGFRMLGPPDTPWRARAARWAGLRPRLRCWSWNDAGARERTPDSEGIFRGARWTMPLGGNQRLLLTQRTVPLWLDFWEVAGGRLRLRASQTPPLDSGSPIVSTGASADGRFFALTAHCFRPDGPDGRFFSRELAIFEGSAPIILRSVRAEKITPLSRAVFSEDSRSVAWWLGGETVHVWALEGKPREAAVLTGFDGKPREIALSSALGWLAVRTETGAIHLWRFSSGKIAGKRKTLRGPSGDYVWLEFLPLSKGLLAENANGKGVTIWDLSGDEARRVLEQKPIKELTAQERKRVAYAPGGPPFDRYSFDAVLPWKYRLHATVTEGRVTVEREAPDGKRKTLLEWQSPGEVHATRFSRDGGHLIVSNANGTVYVVRLDPASADSRLLAACDAALERDPGDVPALLQRARIRLRRSHWRLALDDATRAVRRDRACAEGWFLRGLVHARRGDHERAEQDFSVVVKLQPDNAAALYRRGLSRAEQGGFAAARRDIAAALRIDPGIAGAGR
jgi:WD40 repeat protein